MTGKKIFLFAVLVQPLLGISINGFSQKDFTPQWSKGVVWYQIFPERFSNGDPTNDPKVDRPKWCLSV